MTTANPNLIATDSWFFQEMRQVYRTKMCGFFRRHSSLKSLKAFRILAVSQHAFKEGYLRATGLKPYLVRSLKKAHSGSVRQLRAPGNDVRLSELG